jgi:hypothetical protein
LKIKLAPERFAYIPHFPFCLFLQRTSFSTGRNATNNHGIAKGRSYELEADMFDVKIPA